MEGSDALKAPLASPALTGNPIAPTQASGDSSTKLATTAFVAALPFDPMLGGFTPTNLLKARVGFARSRSDTFARVNVFGNSLAVGSVAAAPLYANGWVGRLRTMLGADLGGQISTGLCIPYTGVYAETDARWTLTGTWGQGPSGTFVNMSIFAGSLATASFTPEIPCDSFRLFFSTGSGAGVITVSIDGGALVSIDTNNPAGGSVSGAISTITISAGSLGTHTIVITAPTTASGKSVYIAGIEANAGTTGVRVSRIARGAMTSIEMVGLPLTAINTFFPADLTYLLELTNDFLHQYDPTTVTQANLTTLMTSALTTGSCILVIPPPPGDSAATYPWTAYVTAAYAAAQAKNVPIIDFTNRWASYTTMNALGMFGDFHHPSTRGHWDMATAIHGGLRQFSVI